MVIGEQEVYEAGQVTKECKPRCHFRMLREMLGYFSVRWNT
jgi:hypothetical protein